MSETIKQVAAMREKMAVSDEAYARFREYQGQPHGDYNTADGHRAYDVEFPSLVAAVAAYNALAHYFHTADLRSATWQPGDSPATITSLTDRVTMTFVCI